MEIKSYLFIRPSLGKLHFVLLKCLGNKKCNKNPNGQNHHTNNKREGQKDMKPEGTKERRKLIPFMVGNYLTHSPSNVICMQIVRFNSYRRFKTSVTHQHNLLFYNKS
jgi:hypothetical protein